MIFGANRYLRLARDAWPRRSIAIAASALLILGSGACFFSVADVRKPGAGGLPGGGAGGAQAGGAAGVGAACSGAAGVCQPVVIAQSPPAAFDLTLDVDDLYWTALDGIYRAAKTATRGVDGGLEHFQKVADAGAIDGGVASAPAALVIDDTWVYFADPVNARISKVEKAGGFAQAVVSVDGPFALAIDADALYYGSQSGAVFRVNKDGSGVRQLAMLSATQPQAIWEIYVNATDVFFGDSDARGVFAVAKDGSSPVRMLTKTTRDVFGLTGDAGGIFFREGDATTGVLSTVTFAGVRSDLLNAEPYPGSVTIDDSFAYFVAGATSNQIRRYDRVSTQVSTIADGQSQAYAVGVDETAIYWTLAGTGEVMKLSK